MQCKLLTLLRHSLEIADCFNCCAMTRTVSMKLWIFVLKFIELPRSKVLTIVFQPRMKFQYFLVWNRNTISCFSDLPWFQHLAYLTNIVNKLNEFSLSVQGCSITVLTAEGKVAALRLKLVFCTNVCKKINLIVSIRWMNILNNRVKYYQDVKCDLRHLQNSFEEYFPQNNNDKNCQRNPFTGSYQM